jgi:GGDEF domain-containing protein
VQAHDKDTGLGFKVAAVRALDEILNAGPENEMGTAAFALSLDDFKNIERQFGVEASTQILKRAADRIVSELRDFDMVVRLEGPRFGIALGAVSRV